MVPTEAQLQAALDDVGVSCFRPLQREAVCALLSNTDVLCILKTGANALLGRCLEVTQAHDKAQWSWVLPVPLAT